MRRKYRCSLVPLLFITVVLSATLYSLHKHRHKKRREEVHNDISGEMTSFLENQHGKCTERINIAFLKTHKCASTTVQNILFRFGATRNLTFMLPERGNYLSREPLQRRHVDRLPWHELGYNILALHTRWNHSAVRGMMPADTMFVTVLRDPLALFRSLYSYSQLDRFRSLERFASAPTLSLEPFTRAANLSLERLTRPASPSRRRLLGVLGRNQMLWDLGVPPKLWGSQAAVMDHVWILQRQFHLVMIAERLDESLVLLSRLMCWRMADVVALDLNVRLPAAREEISEEATNRLKHWLEADYTLYRHFQRRFNLMIDQYGRERMRMDVEELQKAKERTMARCRVTPVSHPPRELQYQQLSTRVRAYVPLNDSAECQSLARGEMQFIEQLRKRQLDMALQHTSRRTRGKDPTRHESAAYDQQNSRNRYYYT